MKEKTESTGRKILRCVLRTLLVLFTLVVLIVAGLVMACQLIFNGPSESARDVLTMTLMEASATKWIPGLFIGQEKVAEIQARSEVSLPEEISNTSQIVISDASSSLSDEWADYPDGIRIETVYGSTYIGHVMIIRDPSTVYLATSTTEFSMDVPGARMNHQFEKEGAIAGINGGGFYDDFTTNAYVGSLPLGLVVSNGEVLYDSTESLADDRTQITGFAGFNEDDILIVASSMDTETAKELNIRDGCSYGPVLVMNGVINETEYNSNSGYNPRTAIGQRADGAVIFVAIDGRQMGSLGGTYADIIDIMVEYGVVNACNLDGGASSTMMYKDTYGRYGEAGQTIYVNSSYLLQEAPRRIPTFFMVRASESEE